MAKKPPPKKIPTTPVAGMPDMTAPTIVHPMNIVVKTDDTTPVLYLHDDVGADWYSDNSSQTWASALDGITTDRIQVRINSVGGSAWDGIAIYNLLKSHPARIEVVVDGIAASAASVVAMAGDTITMATGAQMMIHDASGGCWGDAADMRKTAEALDVCSNSIAAIYANRAGGTVEQWRERMAAETWLTAEQAVELGLSDAEDDTLTVDEASASVVAQLMAVRSATVAHNFTAASVTNRTTPDTLPVTGPGDDNQPEEGTIVNNDDILQGLTTRLGLPADADGTQVLAALDERLNQAVTARYTPPEGTVLMDRNNLEALQAQAQQGADALRMLTDQRREAILDSAERDGRIAPASRESFRKMLDTDETSAVEFLNSLTPNTIPVVEIGYTHTDTPTDELSLDAEYRKFFPEGAE